MRLDSLPVQWHASMKKPAFANRVILLAKAGWFKSLADFSGNSVANCLIYRSEVIVNGIVGG